MRTETEETKRCNPQESATQFLDRASETGDATDTAFRPLYFGSCFCGRRSFGSPLAVQSGTTNGPVRGVGQSPTFEARTETSSGDAIRSESYRGV